MSAAHDGRLSEGPGHRKASTHAASSGARESPPHDRRNRDRRQYWCRPCEAFWAWDYQARHRREAVNGYAE